MSITLSHTKKELYLDCPAAFHLRYNLQIAPDMVSSALPFGVAHDEAQTILLKTRSLVAAREQFIHLWEKPEINYQLLDGKTSNKIFYYKKDFDYTLFKPDELPFQIDPKEELTEDQKMELQEKGFYHKSLYRKGLMMLDAFNDQVMSKIKTVIAVQEEIELENNIGDKIAGKVDLICEWDTGEIVLFDNKSSSQAYSKNKIQEEGGQLAIYHTALKDKYKVDKVGYNVTVKTFNKKNPRVKVQTLIEAPPEQLIEKTIAEFDQVCYNIKQGKFESNHPKCYKPWYKYTGEKCTCQLFDPESYEGFVSLKRNK